MPCYCTGPQKTTYQNIFLDFITALNEAMKLGIYGISLDEINYFISSDANIKEKWCKACRMLDLSQLNQIGQLDGYLRHLCDEVYHNKGNSSEIEKYKREAARLGFEFVEDESGNFFTTKPIKSNFTNYDSNFTNHDSEIKEIYKSRPFRVFKKITYCS